LANTQNQYNGRVDYTLSQKQRLFTRYTFWTVADKGQSEFLDQGFNGATWPTNYGRTEYNTHQAVIGDTYTLNPTTVLDVRVNYVRQYAPNTAQSTSVDESQFGSAYATLASSMNIHLMPGFAASGLHGFYNMNTYPNDGSSWFNTYGVSASVVKILGAHSLKIGAELREMDQSSVNYSSSNSGSFSFNTNYTGDEWASLLMGYPSAVTFKSSSAVAMYTYYQGYYATDTWQATRNLTLNLGLRYEVPGAISERNNKAVVLLPNAVDPITGVKGTEALVASSLYPGRSLTVPHNDLFAPRVGFAYRPGVPIRLSRAAMESPTCPTT
jgi:outer membrane receptor protein involved in Fe transport